MSLTSSLCLLLAALVAAAHSWSLQLLSPCKINVFLRILGRRPTGFHDLASLFQTVSLADDMSFSALPSAVTADILTCSDTALSTGPDNLVVKALELMRRKLDQRVAKQYFQVHLEKKVPIQAGLGGGSGNAATAMFAYNAFHNFPASTAELIEWSADIGSDISFFFSTGTAYCTGRGEIVTNQAPVPDASDVAVHIFKPREGLSTKAVFTTLDLSALSTVSPDALLAAIASKGLLPSAREDRVLVNDLEAPAFTLQPALLRLKRRLEQERQVSGVMMSGSGTSVFALTNTNADLSSVAKEVQQQYPGLQYFPCRLVNRPDDVTQWFASHSST